MEPDHEQPQGRAFAAVVKVAVVALALFLALVGLILIALNRDWLDPWMTSLAAQMSWWLDLFGIPHSYSGIDITLSTRILRVNVDCTAVYIHAIFTAVVVAYPSAAARKVMALIIGNAVIYVANVGRLVAIAALSEYSTDAVFSFVHDYLFQVFMMLVVLVLWMIWMGLERAGGSAPRAPATYWLTTAALSIPIAYVIWLVKADLAPPLDFSGALLLAPALAAIIAARGVDIGRRAMFVVEGIGGFMLVSIALEMSGVEPVVWGDQHASTTVFLLATGLFYLFILGYPTALVLLFIGGRPERLWQRGSFEPQTAEEDRA